MNNNIGYNLKCIRLKHGWTQELVSELTGISIRSISRIENGAAASKKTVRLLCNLYKIDCSSLYKPSEQPKTVKIDLLSENTLSSILCRNSLLYDLQREVVLRFTTVASKSAIMNRSEIEEVLSDAISQKREYTFTDVIAACLAVNKKTIQNFTNIAVA